MIQVKIFYDVRDYSKKRWVYADEQVNTFIKERNIEVVDVKLQMNSTEQETIALLLIYKEN